MKWLIGLGVVGVAGYVSYFFGLDRGQKMVEGRFMPTTPGKFQVRFYLRNVAYPYYAEFNDAETAGKFALNTTVQSWEILQNGKTLQSG